MKNQFIRNILVLFCLFQVSFAQNQDADRQMGAQVMPNITDGEVQTDSTLETISEPIALVEFLQNACPVEEPRTLANIIDRTMEQARSLAKNKCDSISGYSASIQVAIRKLSGFIQESDDCNTYQLKILLEREDAYKIGLIDKSMLSKNYKQCEKSLDFDACIENIYQKSLDTGYNQCKDYKKKRNLITNDIRSSIEEIRFSLHGLIMNSRSCSPEEKLNLINKSLEIMSNLSFVAVSNGLFDVSISMTSETVRAAASIFDGKKIIESHFTKDQINNNLDDISCFGYMLNRSAANCDRKLLRSFKSLESQELPQQDPSALKFIESVKLIWITILDEKKFYDKQGIKRYEDQYVDSSFLLGANDIVMNIITSKIQDPENQSIEITLGDFLGRVSLVLQNQKLGSLKRKGAMIDKFLSEANALDLHRRSTQKLNMKEFLKHNKYFTDVSIDLLSEDMSSFELYDGIVFYAQKTESKSAQDFFNKIKNVDIASKRKINERNVALEISQMYPLDPGDEFRIKRIAYRNFVFLFKSFYEDKMKALNDSLLRDVGFVDDETLFFDIADLAKMCSLGTFPILTEPPSFSQLSREVLKKTPSFYEEACERFKCFIPLYHSDETASEAERYSSFSYNQCNNYYTFPIAMKRMEKEFFTKGTICGQIVKRKTDLPKTTDRNE